tara:strand:- start:70 stop:411 length:342 start_codon:yes stop_codon:yes gene_type:complete
MQKLLKSEKKRQKSWQSIVATCELDKGDVTPVIFGNHELAVYDSKDGIFVSLARCTHGAANLCDGYFDGRNIECPLHQGLFSVKDGEPKAAPARIPLKIFKTRVLEGVVQIFL